MKSAMWMKFGRFRLNLAQIALIERDGDRLIFFNVHGIQIFKRCFEGSRQADQVLRDLFGYEDIQLVAARYEGAEPGESEPSSDEDAT